MTWARYLCVVLSAFVAVGAASQTPEIEEQPYRLSVLVDEVNLTFHAVDGQGRPVTDLTASDLEAFDEGRRPRTIISF